MLLYRKIKLQLTLQIYSLCTHNIIVQTMINTENLHSIIYKHEINLKLYGLTFNVTKYITKAFDFFKLIYNLTINLNILSKLFTTTKKLNK
jgi:hypothetical protein